MSATTDETEQKDVPYDVIEPAIRELCRSINEFPGIITSDSCQGFVDGHRPDEPWHVYFHCNEILTIEGYASIEFIVSLKREARADGFDLSIGVGSPPPYLNGPCQSMYFYIECRNDHPDRLAAFLRDMREKLFCLPDDTEDN